MILCDRYEATCAQYIGEICLWYCVTGTRPRVPSILERSAGSCSRAPCHLTRRSISSGQLGLQLNADFSMEHFLSLNILLKIRIFLFLDSQSDVLRKNWITLNISQDDVRSGPQAGDLEGVCYQVLRNMSWLHRRRIKTEAKSKVVTAVWGQNLFTSLPR